MIFILGDFEMIVRKFPNEKKLKIYPIADVHYGAIGHNKRGWHKFCDMLLKDDAYITIGGDMINNNTRSSVGSPWDDELRPREQKRLMAEMLAPIKDRILCAVEGNHEARSKKDADDSPLYDIMCKLDKEELYRENAAFVKVALGRRGNAPNKAQQSYVIYVAHGSGGGVWTGATVNRAERYTMAMDGVDAAIYGHTHKGVITKPAKIYVDSKNETVSIKPFVVVNCTSWQKFGGYAMNKMMFPAANSDPDAPQTLVLYGENNLPSGKKIKCEW